MHTTVGRNITIRHDGVSNLIIIEHGDKRIMVAMGKEDSLDRLVPLMETKKGVHEFDTYREPLTPTGSSVFGHPIMERMTPLEQHIADNLDIPDVIGGIVMRPVGSEYVVLDHSKIVIPEVRDMMSKRKSHYDCIRCGYMGENNLVHEVGMVCDACMTIEDWRVWDLQNHRDSYPCVKCGKDATEDYLVPEVGMVCDGCMTVADLDAWHAQNKLVNPDSYDNKEEEE
jgi:predicted RNA-binding Zn-ribbon protein involved in translation (DUF1610 family)